MLMGVLVSQDNPQVGALLTPLCDLQRRVTFGTIWRQTEST